MLHETVHDGFCLARESWSHTDEENTQSIKGREEKDGEEREKGKGRRGRETQAFYGTCQVYAR